jgi:hypothetical protein
MEIYFGLDIPSVGLPTAAYFPKKLSRSFRKPGKAIVAAPGILVVLVSYIRTYQEVNKAESVEAIGISSCKFLG